jgi:hypothetical protein
MKMTRLSCHRFRSNQVRLGLSVLAYNLGNLWRRRGIAEAHRQLAADESAATSGQGGQLVKHARYYWVFLAEGHLNRRRFGAMLGRIALLP